MTLDDSALTSPLHSKGVLGQLTEKGWNKLSNQEEVKEVEVRALFNLIDKDSSGELSLEV